MTEKFNPDLPYCLRLHDADGRVSVRCFASESLRAAAEQHHRWTAWKVELFEVFERGEDSRTVKEN